MDYHPTPRDCVVVAEAKRAHVDAFFTFDEQLTLSLASRIEKVRLSSPSAYWPRAKVPR